MKRSLVLVLLALAVGFAVGFRVAALREGRALNGWEEAVATAKTAQTGWRECLASQRQLIKVLTSAQ